MPRGTIAQPSSLFSALISVAEEAQEGAWTDEANTFVLLDAKQMWVAADHECGPAFDRSGDVLIVVWILADASHPILACAELSQDDDVLEPQSRVNTATDVLADF